jgi:bifunctional non-homologous end joining protein LigD
MPAPNQPERITLYYSDGRSDKTYQAQIEPKDGGFVVNFAFGRRGSTLQTGSKTATPVDYAAARKIYDKLVAEKTAKGYSPGEDGTPYQQTSLQARATGVLPQLLNPIDEAEAEKLIADDAWWAQEKLDGKRVLIRRSDQEVIGINRKGLSIALAQPIASFALSIGSQQWVMDGECIGDVFFAFDLLENACADLRTQPYSQRLESLNRLIPAENGAIHGIATASTARSKGLLLRRLQELKKEGVVLKRHDAPYTPGRPASGGDQLKCKFYATASCIVAGINKGKRSVAIELCDGEKRVAVGNVTVPAGKALPKAGVIVEVKYLYAFSGGSLYQPVFLGRRDDLAVADCQLTQLKLRAGSEEDEAQEA